MGSKLQATVTVVSAGECLIRNNTWCTRLHSTHLGTEVKELA